MSIGTIQYLRYETMDVSVLGLGSHGLTVKQLASKHDGFKFDSQHRMLVKKKKKNHIQTLLFWYDVSWSNLKWKVCVKHI